MPRSAIPADVELLFSRLREARVYGSVLSLMAGRQQRHLACNEILFQ